MKPSIRDTMTALTSALPATKEGDALRAEIPQAVHQNAPICTTNGENRLPKPPQASSADAITAQPAKPETREEAAELAARQRAAIALIITGKTFSQVSAELKIDRSTLFRWRQEPSFRSDLNQRTAEMLDAVAMRTRGMMLKSTQLISDSMLGTDRVNCAFKVINSKRVWDIAATRSGTYLD